MPSLRQDLTPDPQNIKELVFQRYGLKIRYKQAWKARTDAFDIIYGKCETSYADLPSYMKMLQLRDSETIVDFDHGEGRRNNRGMTEVHFKRMFWGFGGVN